ncbi:hypothetical protein NQ314_001872 [Rhamnusium bicolor]|uniref:DUF4592 domain-containing protein n=1 Tax=Rhamnusium bicolor TaxID=1586634 RepID=A0AAV8ZT10_9CUCU|nr:hypothetical protein NQ314_001872 [Rhamnusium bicolor]
MDPYLVWVVMNWMRIPLGHIQDIPPNYLYMKKKSNPDSDLEFGPSYTLEPLNHSAAHHRVSVKPKRTHGAPRRKRGQQLSSTLPATPEVNEDSSIRSTSPESNKKANNIYSFFIVSLHNHNACSATPSLLLMLHFAFAETITELYSMSTTRNLTETQLKCSSLPPGLAAPGSETKLNRSKSNAGSKSQDHFSPLHEDAEKEEKPSLFERIFPRKSGRKKKSKEEKETSSKHESKVTKETVLKHEEKNKREEISHEERINLNSVSSSMTKSYTETSTLLTSVSSKHEASKPIAAPRSGAASRQRMVPIDIPVTPDEVRRELNIILPKPSPEKSITGSSPLQTELENRFKQRQISLSASPPLAIPKQLDTPPQSPKSPKSPRSTILPTVISSKTEFTHYAKTSSNTTKHTEPRSRSEEIRNKMKIPGLSPLQQRVLSLNDDETDNTFKSLTDFTSDSHKPSKPITKSHSFKSTKQSFDAENKDVRINCTTAEFSSRERKEENRISFTKAASLDSIKNLEEQTHQSELKFVLKPFTPDVSKSSENKVEVKTDKDDKKKSDILNDLEVFRDSITISGPCHTAVVNVTSNSENFTSSTSKMTSNSNESAIVEKDGSKTISIKENQVSVTKIQLKRETTQVTQSTITVPKSSVPEFLNKQLNKVEVRPSSNIIFSMKSPRIMEEQNRPKTVFNFEAEPEIITKPPAPRKFSKENLEIIEKNDKEEKTEASPKTPPVVTVTSLTPQPIRFKKNETKNTIRKSSVISITPDSPVREKALFKSRSISLDSLKSDVNESDRSSQDSLDKLEERPKEKGSPVSETVVLRRKSLANKKNDEEPELMKVFARRSLKSKDDVDSIQDNLVDIKTRDSDKENQVDSPVDDRKKWYSKPKETLNEADYPQRRKSLVKQESVDIKTPAKEPLIETKIPDVTRNNSKDSLAESPVALRRTMNNNIFISQRAASVNPPKTVQSDLLVKKQASFTERRKTDQWMTNLKNEEAELKDKMQDEIISSDFITEPKNFNQRKAEWEKRAQQAQKKTTP